MCTSPLPPGYTPACGVVAQTKWTEWIQPPSLGCTGPWHCSVVRWPTGHGTGSWHSMVRSSQETNLSWQNHTPTGFFSFSERWRKTRMNWIWTGCCWMPQLTVGKRNPGHKPWFGVTFEIAQRHHLCPWHAGEMAMWCGLHTASSVASKRGDKWDVLQSILAKAIISFLSLEAQASGAFSGACELQLAPHRPGDRAVVTNHCADMPFSPSSLNTGLLRKTVPRTCETPCMHICLSRKFWIGLQKTQEIYLPASITVV